MTAKWSSLLYHLLNPLAGTTNWSCLTNRLPCAAAENIVWYVLTASKSTAPLLSVVVPGHPELELKETVLNENTSDTSYWLNAGRWMEALFTVQVGWHWHHDIFWCQMEDLSTKRRNIQAWCQQTLASHILFRACQQVSPGHVKRRASVIENLMPHQSFQCLLWGCTEEFPVDSFFFPLHAFSLLEVQ